MKRCNYFDWASTAPLRPGVLEAMMPYFGDDYGNPQSIHNWGTRAREAVENARSQVAALLGCAPEEVTFTSGATESNNWVLQSFVNVSVSPLEHSSIREQALELGYSFLDHEGYEIELDPEADICSLMLVNNETGGILAKKGSCNRTHRDVTQALGKLSIDLSEIDYASFSSHKLGGPKGIGGLYSKNAELIEPLLYGGGQEHGVRSGTLNVPAIVGFGKACELALLGMEAEYALAKQCRETVLDELQTCPDWQINDSLNQSPFVLSLSFEQIEGETLVIEADSSGFGISSGAACSSRSTEPSHVLTAIAVEDHMIRGTVRISFGRENTVESSSQLAKVLRNDVHRIRNHDHRS